MPTYTASILSAAGGNFSHCENIVVTGKDLRAALDQLELRFGRRIAFSRRDYYTISGTSQILYIERYSSEMPKLSDFKNLPTPAPPEKLRPESELQEACFVISIFELAEGKYVLSEQHEVKAATKNGALRVFSKPKKGLPAQKPQSSWQKMLHYWLDDEERILFATSRFETPESLSEKLPQPRPYYLELVEGTSTTTYKVQACSPWAAARYLGECLGTKFENRHHLGPLPRFDVEDDSAYCIVHFKEIPWKLSI